MIHSKINLYRVSKVDISVNMPGILKSIKQDSCKFLLNLMIIDFIARNLEDAIMDIAQECRSLETRSEEVNYKSFKTEICHIIEQIQSNPGLINLIVFVAGVEESRIVQKGNKFNIFCHYDLFYNSNLL